MRSLSGPGSGLRARAARAAPARAEARERQGGRFNRRRFRDAVLGVGALPLQSPPGRRAGADLAGPMEEARSVSGSSGYSRCRPGRRRRHTGCCFRGHPDAAAPLDEGAERRMTTTTGPTASCRDPVKRQKWELDRRRSPPRPPRMPPANAEVADAEAKRPSALDESLPGWARGGAARPRLPRLAAAASLGAPRRGHRRPAAGRPQALIGARVPSIDLRPATSRWSDRHQGGWLGWVASARTVPRSTPKKVPAPWDACTGSRRAIGYRARWTYKARYPRL